MPQAEMRVYQVVLTPVGGLIEVTVPQLGRMTQGETREEALEMARDLISVLTGAPLDTVQVTEARSTLSTV